MFFSMNACELARVKNKKSKICCVKCKNAICKAHTSKLCTNCAKE